MVKKPCAARTLPWPLQCLQVDMPVLRSKDIGDLYVQLDIETPQALSRRQRELLEEFAKLETEETNPTSNGFFDKLKRMFES